MEEDILSLKRMPVDIQTTSFKLNEVNDDLIQRIPCSAHLMQLAVKDSLKKNVWAKKIEQIVRKLTSFFNKSTSHTNKLKKLAGVKLVKIGETRWNSLYHAIKRICRPVSIFKQS